MAAVSSPTGDLADNPLRLAIAAFAAIACLAIIHRAIFAGFLARGLVGRQRGRANYGRDDGTHNFGEPLHTNLNFPSAKVAREKFHFQES